MDWTLQRRDGLYAQFAPLTTYEHLEGLSAKINDIVLYNGQPYVATINDVFTLTNAGFENAGQLGLDCQDLLVSNGRLLVATVYGVYDLSSGTAREVLTDVVALSMMSVGDNQERVYVGTANGIRVLTYQDGWKAAGKIKGVTESVNSLFSSGDALWAGTGFQGVLKIEGDPEAATVTRYGEAAGLPSGLIRVVSIDGKTPVFQTREGIYTQNGGKFSQDETLTQKLGDKSATIVRADDGSVWVSDQNGFRVAANSQLAFDSTLSANVVDEPADAILPLEDGAWVAFQDRLMKVNSRESSEAENFNVVLSRVSAGDSLLSGVAAAKADEAPELPYSMNALTFSFGATSYLNPAKTRYQYQLEGFDAGWSPLGKQASVSYTNLREGLYTFKVRANNPLGQVSEVATYTFRISAPWYRTLVAYIGYGVLAVVLVFGFVRLNAVRLERRNKRLEAEVAQRTEELSQEKHKVEEANAILEEKNEDIMDSITYARRIQLAILPEKDQLKRALSGIGGVL